jgi:hypothetical protein
MIKLIARTSTVLCLLFFISCKKNVANAVNCRSVAYVIDKKDSVGKLYKIDTSISWPKVCGEDLQRFMRMSTKPERFCGCNGCYLRLVIFKKQDGQQ